jgi:hypothetical protein
MRLKLSVRAHYIEAHLLRRAARDVDVTRSLNPSVQSFDQWFARNKNRISLK